MTSEVSHPGKHRFRRGQCQKDGCGMREVHWLRRHEPYLKLRGPEPRVKATRPRYMGTWG